MMNVNMKFLQFCPVGKYNDYKNFFLISYQKSYFEKCMDNLKGYKIIFNYFDFSHSQKDVYIYPKPEMNECIFCLRNESEASFKKRPHLIPELLGNKHLLHYQECDDCNQKFGLTLEQDLAVFAEPFRMLGRIQSKKNKYVGYYYPYNCKRNFVFNKSTNIFQTVATNEDIIFDEQNKEFTYNFHIKKHIPVNVFKAFMKIFYGAIPANYRQKFSLLRKFIINDDLSNVLIKPLNVLMTFLPYMNKKPLTVFILHKETKSFKECIESNILTDDFSFMGLLAFGNVIFEIPVWCDDDLCKFSQKIELNLKKLPNPYDIRQYQIIDFSGTEKMSQKIPITFHYGEKILIEELAGKSLDDVDDSVNEYLRRQQNSNE